MLQYSNLFSCIGYIFDGVIASFSYPIAICKDFPSN